MFTSAEAQELRAYYARYPFDDESNVWLPHGLLMAKLHAFMGVKDDQKTVKDFMPFANIAEEQAAPEPQPEPRPYTKKQLKRIQKYKGW